jgi:hypothetical protein
MSALELEVDVRANQVKYNTLFTHSKYKLKKAIEEK